MTYGESHEVSILNDDPKAFLWRCSCGESGIDEDSAGKHLANPDRER